GPSGAQAPGDGRRGQRSRGGRGRRGGRRRDGDAAQWRSAGHGGRVGYRADAVDGGELVGGASVTRTAGGAGADAERHEGSAGVGATQRATTAVEDLAGQLTGRAECAAVRQWADRSERVGADRAGDVVRGGAESRLSR